MGGLSPTSTTGATVKQSARTSNIELGVLDNGYFVNITSGTFTQTFAAAAVLDSGWYVYIKNNGTGEITLNPDGAELIDGLANYIMYPGECRLIQCDGTALTSIVLSPFSVTYTSTSTFTRPPGYTQFGGLLWAGGGSGAKDAGATGWGGGGGACVPVTMPAALMGTSQTITIGAGGAGKTSAGAGNTGGNTSIGSIVTAYGGCGGGIIATAAGGAGGGALSAGTVQDFSSVSNVGAAGGGLPGVTLVNITALMDNQGFGGGNSRANNTTGGHSFYGGASGSNAIYLAGKSVYGGGGGGGNSTGDLGTSIFAGSGGQGGTAGDGAAGSFPSGGGGATASGTTSGAGGAGQASIWGIA